MIESLLSTLGVLFVPDYVAGLTMPGGILGEILLSNIVVVLLIALITTIMNMVRAYRYCKEDSLGIEFGLRKGLTAGTVAVIGSILVGLIPILRLPFTIISFIPGLDTMVSGIVLALCYLIGYYSVAYPIWGNC